MVRVPNRPSRPKAISIPKRAVRELAMLHRAKIVLIEDKASGSSLIQELRAEHFSLMQAAPALDGDKVMRLRAQTAKIKGGFVLFPKHAPWLEAYVRELLSFPNSKYDDQVDSTVFALAWATLHPRYPGWTDQSIKNFANFVDSFAMDSYFGLMTGRPW
jgi:predicted phage terminase large subunit-like protein